jgi:hypothetical protein
MTEEECKELTTEREWISVEELIKILRHYPQNLAVYVSYEGIFGHLNENRIGLLKGNKAKDTILCFDVDKNNPWNHKELVKVHLR